jgi:hypothetical protein
MLPKILGKVFIQSCYLPDFSGGSIFITGDFAEANLSMPAAQGLADA